MPCGHMLIDLKNYGQKAYNKAIPRGRPKYGKPKFRLLNRVRNHGGKGNWKLELHFISIRENGLIKVQAHFYKAGKETFSFTKGTVYSEGQYMQLTSNSRRPSGLDLGFASAPEFGR